MNPLFYDFPGATDDPYIEVQVGRHIRLCGGTLILKVSLAIPSAALLLRDEKLKVFGEALSPYWGDPGVKNGRVKTIARVVNYDNLGDIESDVNNNFWDIVTEAQETLSKYFVKRARLLAVIADLNHQEGIY